MIFIGGISMGQKMLDFIQTMICKSCGRYTGISVYMTYTYFSFFFIPLFKWGKKYYAVTSCCNTVYAIPDVLGRAIERGETVTLTEDDLTPTGEAMERDRRCPNCGYPLQGGYTYCPGCGRKLDDMP